MAQWWFWLLAWVKALLQRIPWSNRSFLVLSSGRSGSTLLMQYLRSHPSIACSLEEPLNPEELSFHGLNGANISPYTLVNYLMTQLLSWSPYSGCKIFCQQLEHHRLPFADLLNALRDPPVIVLYRENLLETYVSLQLAFKTGVWFSVEENNKRSSVEVDFEEYRHYAEEERRRWRVTLSAFAKRSKKRVHFLSYEDLNANKEECLAGVFKFLHLSSCKTIAYSKKQNPTSLFEKVSNFDDLKERLNKCGGHILTREWMEGCITQM